MLCIRYNCGLVFYYKGMLECADCGHIEHVALPENFDYVSFITLAYGEDFHNV